MALGVAAGCRSQARPAPDAHVAVPTGTVIFMPDGHPDARVKVRVVKSIEARRRGLMFVRELADDEGMLFLFRDDQQQSFWMQNTYVALDMIFVRSDMTVLGVYENARPLTEDPRAVPGESRYVVEVNAGWARKRGVRDGTRVKFENVSMENIE